MSDKITRRNYYIKSAPLLQKKLSPCMLKNDEQLLYVSTGLQIYSAKPRLQVVPTMKDSMQMMLAHKFDDGLESRWWWINDMLYTHSKEKVPDYDRIIHFYKRIERMSKRFPELVISGVNINVANEEVREQINIRLL